MKFDITKNVPISVVFIATLINNICLTSGILYADQPNQLVLTAGVVLTAWLNYLTISRLARIMYRRAKTPRTVSKPKRATIIYNQDKAG